MTLANFLKKLKQIVNLHIVKMKENYFLSFEDGVDIIYTVNNFVDEGKAKKVLHLLTSISLAKCYYHFFGFGHFGCYCWHCRLQNECLQVLIKRATNKVALMGSYDILKIKEDDPYPFYEEWRIKNNC